MAAFQLELSVLLNAPISPALSCVLVLLLFWLLLLFLARLKVTRKQMKSYRVWPIKLAGFLPNLARFSLELPS